MLFRLIAASLLLALTSGAQPAAKAASGAPAKATRPAAGRTLRVVMQSPEPVEASKIQATLANGTSARVVRVRGAKDDLLLLLVTDLTGDLTRIDRARTALTEALAALPANAWVGLLRAQDGPRVITDPGPEREEIATALKVLPVTGKSALLDTVAHAVQLADAISAKTQARVAVLYISDSDIRNYREDFTNPVINTSDSRDLSRRFPEGLVRERIARLRETLAAYQTPVFIAHLQFSSERLNEAYQSGLTELAAASGGATFFSRTLSDVADTVTRALSAVQSHGQALVQLPPKVPRAVTISLQAEGARLEHRTRFVVP